MDSTATARVWVAYEQDKICHMNDDLRTCDSILAWLKEQTESRRPISPQLWMEAARSLNVLSSDENDKLIDLRSQLAALRAELISAGQTGVATKMLIEANPLFAAAQRQEAKMKRIEEAIRLAKLSARIKSDELRANI